METAADITSDQLTSTYIKQLNETILYQQQEYVKLQHLYQNLQGNYEMLQTEINCMKKEKDIERLRTQLYATFQNKETSSTYIVKNIQEWLAEDVLSVFGCVKIGSSWRIESHESSETFRHVDVLDEINTDQNFLLHNLSDDFFLSLGWKIFPNSIAIPLCDCVIWIFSGVRHKDIYQLLADLRSLLETASELLISQITEEIELEALSSQHIVTRISQQLFEQLRTVENVGALQQLKSRVDSFSLAPDIYCEIIFTSQHLGQPSRNYISSHHGQISKFPHQALVDFLLQSPHDYYYSDDSTDNDRSREQDQLIFCSLWLNSNHKVLSQDQIGYEYNGVFIFRVRNRKFSETERKFVEKEFQNLLLPTLDWLNHHIFDIVRDVTNRVSKAKTREGMETVHLGIENYLRLSDDNSWQNFSNFISSSLHCDLGVIVRQGQQSEKNQHLLDLFREDSTTFNCSIPFEEIETNVVKQTIKYSLVQINEGLCGKSVGVVLNNIFAESDDEITGSMIEKLFDFREKSASFSLIPYHMCFLSFNILLNRESVLSDTNSAAILFIGLKEFQPFSIGEIEQNQLSLQRLINILNENLHKEVVLQLAHTVSSQVSALEGALDEEKSTQSQLLDFLNTLKQTSVNNVENLLANFQEDTFSITKDNCWTIISYFDAFSQRFYGFINSRWISLDFKGILPAPNINEYPSIRLFPTRGDLRHPVSNQSFSSYLYLPLMEIHQSQLVLVLFFVNSEASPASIFSSMPFRTYLEFLHNYFLFNRLELLHLKSDDMITQNIVATNEYVSKIAMDCLLSSHYEVEESDGNSISVSSYLIHDKNLIIGSQFWSCLTYLCSEKTWNRLMTLNSLPFQVLIPIVSITTSPSLTPQALDMIDLLQHETTLPERLRSLIMMTLSSDHGILDESFENSSFRLIPPDSPLLEAISQYFYTNNSKTTHARGKLAAIYTYKTSVHSSSVPFKSHQVPDLKTSYTFQFHIVLTQSSNPPVVPFLTSSDWRALHNILRPTLQLSEFLYQFHSFKQEIQSISRLLNISVSNENADSYTVIEDAVISQYFSSCVSTITSQTNSIGSLEFIDGQIYNYDHKGTLALRQHSHISGYTTHSLPRLPERFPYQLENESFEGIPLTQPRIYSYHNFQLYLSDPEVYRLQKLGSDDRLSENNFQILLIPFGLASDVNSTSQFILMRVKWNYWNNDRAISNSQMLIPSTIAHLSFLSNIFGNYLRTITQLRNEKEIYQSNVEKHQNYIVKSHYSQLSDISNMLDEIIDLLTEMIPQHLDTHAHRDLVQRNQIEEYSEESSIKIFLN